MKVYFFSEGSEHNRFILDLIKEIRKYPDIEIFLISKDKDNELNNLFGKNQIILNNDFELINFLLKIESDYFITTTPEIGSPKFPRSKVLPKILRPKYVYLFHSLVSPNEMYKKNSFYNFDIIFTPNKTISENLKFLISKYTKVYESGYFLEGLKEYDSDSRLALFAPSWGNDSPIKDFEFIRRIKNDLNKDNISLVVRPHPMSFKNIEIINYLDKNFILDNEKNLTNLGKYKYLFTDKSGIALEYSLVTNRKFVYLDTPKKIKRKLSRQERKINLIEDIMIEKLSISIEEFFNKSSLSNIEKKIEISEPSQSMFLEELIYPKSDYAITIATILFGKRKVQ